ncbi:hypothetical protein GSN00_05515 [Cylindrospermopsis raciborskii CHAB3438]|uniref:FkbM family methyltransferase n=1 Tax=Cylindrospermopsis raciborskii TaxID=77022 RepID=UPI001F107B3B|nr:FkbM family methyltransferase [Cylindrospermopsis raciborskii]MCH4903857.1 hypothetical protein [Cylindrospermopsis raciborskii CHAB3438]
MANSLKDLVKSVIKQITKVISKTRIGGIKMDVDGLEHFILKGGSQTLTQIKGILIEVNDDFYEQASTCSKLLTDAGLILREKRHSEMFADSAFANTYNQIWIRP